MDNWRERLKSVIRKRGITITEFSKEVGIPRQTISDWLKGGEASEKWRAAILEKTGIDILESEEQPGITKERLQEQKTSSFRPSLRDLYEAILNLGATLKLVEPRTEEEKIKAVDFHLTSLWSLLQQLARGPKEQRKKLREKISPINASLVTSLAAAMLEGEEELEVYLENTSQSFQSQNGGEK